MLHKYAVLAQTCCLYFFCHMLRSSQINAINFLLLPILLIISISIGAASFHWGDLLISSDTRSLLLYSRLPRSLAIILTGATLAVAGMVLQIVLRNRFLEPSMVGATQSAALGVLLISIWLPQASQLTKMSCASLAALLGMTLFLFLFRRLPAHRQLMIPLIGIIYGSIIEALVNFIGVETNTLQLLAVWFAGDFSAVISGRYKFLWGSWLNKFVVFILRERVNNNGWGKEGRARH